MLRWPP